MFCHQSRFVINHQKGGIESVSKPLVDFGVLNDNLIKGLILCIKRLSRF
jgi:hypothetical protein